jgi:TPR repeat protein
MLSSLRPGSEKSDQSNPLLTLEPYSGMDAVEVRQRGAELEKLHNNDLEAFSCYRFAAQKGDMVAQERLGKAYWCGDLGLAASQKESFQFFIQSARQGSRKALDFFGLLYAWDALEYRVYEQIMEEIER